MDMAVTNQLTRLVVRGREAQTDHNIVETTFQLREQMFAGHSLLPCRFLEIGPELTFEHAVDSFHLLFFAQLQAISDDLCLAIAAVLTRRKVALLDSARGFETSLAFEEELHSFS